MIRATSRALCSHGYADLSIEKFGREFEKSPSLIYHHYEGDELLLDFLGFMLERFEADAVDDRGIGPADRLRALVDHLLPERLPEDRDAFQRAMVALRAQGTHDGEYRAKFCLSEELFHGHLASLLAAGVDVGAFP